MSQRPKVFYFLAILHLLIAIGFPLQIMWQFNHSLWDLQQIYYKIAPLNWLVIAICLFQSFFIWRGSRFAVLISLFLIPLVAYNNFLVAVYNINYTWQDTCYATFGFFVFNLLFLEKNSLKTFISPAKRWWLVAKRKRVEAPIMIGHPLGTPIKAEMFDISTTGIFIKANKKHPDHKKWFAKSFYVGQVIWIQFSLGSSKPITCQAEVVRLSPERGIYPNGMGITFKNLTLPDNMRLHYLHRHC